MVFGSSVLKNTTFVLKNGNKLLECPSCKDKDEAASTSTGNVSDFIYKLAYIVCDIIQNFLRTFTMLIILRYFIYMYAYTCTIQDILCP